MQQTNKHTLAKHPQYFTSVHFLVCCMNWK